MFPTAFLGIPTLTGDAIVGPGAPTVIIGVAPVSCTGDAVTGAACTGTVGVGSFTVLACGRPVNRLSTPVMGVNPASGVPVTTATGAGSPTVLTS
ncbi:hypothetical protein Pan216_52380 [Planctomycetes bacterium Pan216]|uniref:PAAR motif protein n=1 Tax=Kolteria novifilia TaxID=2527975 RepID=A0A518BBI4_9BACT|nr:hypothetical protein Pan216_52380 [Planctomycetes bacterium Pan216]